MGYDVDEAAAAEVLRVYDDRPHDGKMDIGEFAQLVHDLAPRLGKGKKGGGGGGGGGLVVGAAAAGVGGGARGRRAIGLRVLRPQPLGVPRLPRAEERAGAHGV